MSHLLRPEAGRLRVPAPCVPLAQGCPAGETPGVLALLHPPPHLTLQKEAGLTEGMGLPGAAQSGLGHPHRHSFLGPSQPPTLGAGVSEGESRVGPVEHWEGQTENERNVWPSALAGPTLLAAPGQEPGGAEGLPAGGGAGYLRGAGQGSRRLPGQADRPCLLSCAARSCRPGKRQWAGAQRARTHPCSGARTPGVGLADYRGRGLKCQPAGPLSRCPTGFYRHHVTEC